MVKIFVLPKLFSPHFWLDIVFFLQEVMVKEKLAAIGKPLRKFASTPNLAAAVRSNLFYFVLSSFPFLFLGSLIGHLCWRLLLLISPQTKSSLWQ